MSIEQRAYNRTIEKLIDHCDEMISEIWKNKELLQKLKARQHDIHILMYMKKVMMIGQLELPLRHTHCYFCMLRDIANEESPFDNSTCENCEYGKKYGICNESSSHYNKLMQSLNNLRRDVMNYYKMTED